jgi:dolichol-phosphate mannosyltransferase
MQSSLDNRTVSNDIPDPGKNRTFMSIIVPTYNESQNILRLVNAIKDNLPHSVYAEIIIVDDNSPDGTGGIVEKYIENESIQQNQGIYNLKITDNNTDKNCLVKVVHRQNKSGLISAYLRGIECSTGQNILLMDADFSHPPEAIPTLINELLQDPNCIVVCSRYIGSGSILGWPYKRKIISRGAAKIARYGLNVRNVKDPMSNFFAFPRHVIENIKIDSKGYKILIEILVKTRGTLVKEIPYTFIDRKAGESKMDFNVILDYIRSVWYLYRYGQKSAAQFTQIKGEKRKSVFFLSKASRFYTVSAIGVVLNYLISVTLSNGIISNLGHMPAVIIGIVFSITSNFFLNKVWTFEDRNFSFRKTLKQYGLFASFNIFGAAIQLILLFIFLQSGLQYNVSLILAIAIAPISNFLLNKKWTFREKIWS